MTFLEKVFLIIMCAAFIMITGVAKANPVTEWFLNEKQKIVEYQTKSWADSKTQLAQTKQSILNLFKGKKDVAQD